LGIQVIIVSYSFVLLSGLELFGFLAPAQRPGKSMKPMKEALVTSPGNSDADELLPEYDFDYSKARPNRFAPGMSEDSQVIILDPDVAKVFTTSKSVNAILRALITTMPKTP